MIFKCGCKSIVGHDSEGDATLTLDHSSTCKHAKSEIEKLTAENVELVGVVKSFLKSHKPKGKGECVCLLCDEMTLMWIRGLLLCSPSAKWLEAVNEVIEKLRFYSDDPKFDFIPVSDALDKLTKIERL